MNRKKRNFLISAMLILVAIGFTILVKVVDVKQVGVNETYIGFATINQFVFKYIGVNMIWYHITDWSDPEENKKFFNEMGLTDEQIIPVKMDIILNLC